MPETKRPKLWLHILSALGLAVLVFGSSLLWLENSESFPELASGIYVGELELDTSPEFKLGLLVESFPEKGFLDFFLLGSQTESYRVSPAEQQGGQKLYPITIPYSRGEITFNGRAVDSSTFSGALQSEASGIRGRWSLNRVTVASRIELSGAGWSEKHSALIETAEDRSKLLDQELLITSELNLLEEILAEPQLIAELVKRQKESLSIASLELSRQEQSLAKELAELEQKVSFALSLSKTGKPFELWRELTESEDKWIRSQRKTTALLSPQARRDLERLSRVELLLEQIRREEDRLIDLRGGGAGL